MTASVAWVVRWTQFVLFLSLSGVFLLQPAVSGGSIHCPALCACLEKFVDCSRKGLTILPNDLPTWTTQLEFIRNKIKRITAEAFVGLTSLESLNISNNEVHTIEPDTWIETPHLKVLRLSNNLLDALPRGLHRLSKLEELILNSNEISLPVTLPIESSLPTEHPLPHSLQSLDLSANRIESIIPEWFAHLKHLQVLNLQRNRISDIGRGSLDNLTLLKNLNLSRNKLTKLPKDIFKKNSQLRKLDLSRNQLSTIEGLTFQALDQLDVLNLRRNRIALLSDGAFYGLNNIQQLHLEFNIIPNVSKTWLYGLNSLRQLYLQNNSITNIMPQAFESCGMLQELNIEHNSIENINQGCFLHLSSILSINLCHNRINFIEESSFKTLNNLQKLDLSHNEISWAIEDTKTPFNGLSKLTRLGLANNSIQAIPAKAFVGLSKVSSLDLDMNPISTINQDAFAVLKKISDIRLNTSALLCDCALKWLPEWLKLVGVDKQVWANCAFPVEFRGVDLFAVEKLGAWTCGVFDKPVILSKASQTLQALKGHNISLSCKATMNTTVDAELITFDWRKENKIIKFDKTYRVLETLAETDDDNRIVFTSILNLQNVQDADEGRYQCIARNRFGSSYSNKSRVSLQEYPVFTRTPPARMTGVAGESVVLECEATGQPKPVISWQKDGGDDFPAARERRMQLMKSNVAFYIEGLKLADQGLYTCTANNSAGPVRTNVTLTVLEAPPLLRPIQSEKVREGEKATIECLSDGTANSTRRWYKDGLPLEETERHMFAGQQQILFIPRVLTKDAGKYACEIDSNTQRVVFLLSVVPQNATSSLIWPSIIDKVSTLGIVSIAVLIGVIITSLIWVAILLVTRKKPDLQTLSTPSRNSRHYLSGAPQSVYGRACSADEEEEESVSVAENDPMHGVNTRLLVDDANRTIINMTSGKAYFMKESLIEDDEGISSGGSSSTSHHATPAHHGVAVAHRVSTFQPDPPGNSCCSSSSLASVEVHEPDDEIRDTTQTTLLATPSATPKSSPKPALPRKPPHLTPQPPKKLHDQILLRQKHQLEYSGIEAEDPELIEISRRCQRTLSQRSINNQLRKSTLTPNRLTLEPNVHMDSPDQVFGGTLTPTATIRRTPGPRSPSPNAVVPVPPPCIPGPFCYENGPPNEGFKSRPVTPKRTSTLDISEEQKKLKPFCYGNPFEDKALRKRLSGGDVSKGSLKTSTPKRNVHLLCMEDSENEKQSNVSSLIEPQDQSPVSKHQPPTRAPPPPPPPPPPPNSSSQSISQTTNSEQSSASVSVIV